MDDEEKKPEDEMNQEGGSEMTGGSEQQVFDEKKPSIEQASSAESEGAAAKPVVEKTGGSGGRKWLLVIVLLLTVGLGAVVVGFVSGRRAKQAKLEEREEQSVIPTPAVEAEDELTAEYEQQSDSDEIADIEADIQNTSLEGLDKELVNINSELSAED